MNAALAVTTALVLMHPSFASASQPGARDLLPEQFASTADHQDKEEKFVVRAASAMPQPCLAVASQDNNIAILVSRELLDTLASNARKNGYKDETERLEMIVARRARALLDSVEGGKTRHGCLEASINAETQYLIGRLLNSGQAAILDTRTNRIYPSFTVLISSRKGVGGMAAYRVEDEASAFRTFLAYQTWVG